MAVFSGDNAQIEYAIYDGKDVTVYGASCVFTNAVFDGLFAASNNVTVRNAFLLGSITVDTGYTLTLVNCISSNAKPAVDGTIDDTDCQWGVDPKFIDAPGGDYRLMPDSLGIDAGLDAGLTEDYEGRAVGATPDIGAFEMAWITAEANVHTRVSSVPSIQQYFQCQAEANVHVPVSSVPDLVQLYVAATAAAPQATEGDTYTTVQGDMWDMIALAVYGSEQQMHNLLAANPVHRETVFFSAGVVLTVPEIDTATINEALPPWKQDALV